MPIKMLNFNGIIIEAEVKNVRSLSIRVRRDGSVRLSIPLGTPPEEAHRFVVEHEDWIRKHSDASKQKQEALKSLTAHDFHEGERFRVFEKDYPLHCIPAPRAKGCRLADGQFILECPPDLSTAKKLALVNKFYSTLFREAIDRLLAVWLPRMEEDRHPVTYSLFLARSRWGTCKPALRHIRLNMHLLFYPRECLELIVVHELCHLKEASHNARFHALMQTYLPDYKTRDKILKNHLLA